MNPFVGLRPYEKEEAPRLFGRERDLAIVQDRVLSARTTLLFAASGVGKTSFLNAKLIPKMSGKYLVFTCRSWAGMEPRLSVLRALIETLKEEKTNASPKIKQVLELLQLVVETSQGTTVAALRDVALASFLPQLLGGTDSTSPHIQPLVDVIRYLAGRSHQEGSAQDSCNYVEQKLLEVQLSTIFELMKPGRCMLVLDQFEEVFQNEALDAGFQRFLDELSALANGERADVRVIFSIREEFVGELSVFDNLIPDLFNNYYRLKHPSKEQGASIIERTCARAHTTIDLDGLSRLLRDLSRIRRGSISAGNRIGNKAAEEVETDRITLPYMQLVCHDLWEEQRESSLPFLHYYAAGDATAVRDKFFKRKLGFLTFDEQLLLSKALDHLITKRGAKIPAEVHTLSDALGSNAAEVARVLGKLSAPDTRILKESSLSDGTQWFELYHDMYAGFFYQWKEDLRQKEQKREINKLLSLRELPGVRPDEIADWEETVNPLDEFWVYLPDFLGGAEESIARKIVDVMAHNFAFKNSQYLYIVEARADVARLFALVNRLKRHELCRNRRVAGMVRVLVLSAHSAADSVAEAVTSLLHIGNCWIANPLSTSAEGYEVAWNAHGTKPQGGRKLPYPKLRRIVDSIRRIVESFPPRTFESVTSEADLDQLTRDSPTIRVEVPVVLPGVSDRGARLT